MSRRAHRGAPFGVRWQTGLADAGVSEDAREAADLREATRASNKSKKQEDRKRKAKKAEERTDKAAEQAMWAEIAAEAELEGRVVVISSDDEE